MNPHDSSPEAPLKAATHDAPGVDSAYAWWRLACTLLLVTCGGVGMWSVVVSLPAIQAEFGVARGAASLPYAATMVGVGFAGLAMGRMADRFGVAVPVVMGILCLGAGYPLAAASGSLAQFVAVQGLLLAAGSAASLSPLISDTSLWFERRRGLAVGICASGNYLAGALWPPVLQHFIETAGWRQTHVWVGVFCLAVMLPASLVLRRRPPRAGSPGAARAASASVSRPLGMAPATLQFLLLVAGFGCCVAMAMPQVHMVAYCADLGYGPARGAQLLSVMLACGVVSRLGFGMISDRIGGLRTLMVGSGLQCLALLLFLPAQGPASLTLVAALFGLFQGGIVPAYAIIVREHCPAAETGTRVAMVITATLFGMALGGWMSGAIFDLTGSYAAAFLNGIGWNAVNLIIAAFLLHRARGAGPGGRLAMI
ncbi:MAG: MFS transporter [Betaproteobacteria bacterium]